MRLKMQAYICKNCCKQQFSKKALFWYDVNLRGIIILPYDDKQFILLTSMGKIIPNYSTLGKTIPNHDTFWEIIIPKYNTIWKT